ncbi:MAG: Gfo/Idh/MocA family oxidoreductase [Planctomycetota bacterium]|nr:Gfo/Idh/MocA family oxidoreductase [Planctomycetota bacterium]
MDRIRIGLIGGKPGAFIGDAHRMAMLLDGEIELVAACCSSDPERARAAGVVLGLAPERCYPSYQDLLRAEAALPPEQRIQAIANVTPNAVHAPVALAALRAGFHVIADKPLCMDLAEAEALVTAVRDTGLVFALTHNYSGYPMVKQARELVASGALGAIRKVVVEYPQGGLARALPRAVAQGDLAALEALRVPQKRTARSACMADIGTHAAQLAEYVTGLSIDQVCADCDPVVPGRELDADAHVLLRLNGGARGILFASQIAAGEENPLAIRVWGEAGGLRWRQMEPNTLELRKPGEPIQLLRAGGAYNSAAAKAATRMPNGHPEGYIEAFATIYRNAARCIRAHAAGVAPDAIAADVPSVADGRHLMAVVEAVADSAAANSAWTPVPRFD